MNETPDPLEPSADQRTVLVSAQHAAEREQRRLAERVGRQGIAGMLGAASIRLRAVGGADAAERGLRYQPVIWTVIAITAVAFWFPGADGADDLLGASTAVASPATVPVSPPATVPPVTTPTTIAPARPAAPALAPPRPVAAPAPRPSPAIQPTSARSPAPLPPVDVSDGEEEEVELAVRGFGWFSGASGAVSTTPVPEGTMPVANRLGAEDKVSLVRLSGTASTLVLREDPDGADEAVGPAALKLCVVEEASWQEEPGQGLADAPPWSDTCTEGRESEGTWQFDLAGMGDPEAATGFALVPGGDAPLEFQVTFVP